MTTIWFDMDGTIADLYGVENWLDYLLAESSIPYSAAKPLLNMSLLARYLNKLSHKGYKIGIISWGSKKSTAEYLETVKAAKRGWIKKHLPSVTWDDIKIVEYGTSKWHTCGHDGILFDDEEKNRTGWENGKAYLPNEIMRILKELEKAI